MKFSELHLVFSVSSNIPQRIGKDEALMAAEIGGHTWIRKQQIPHTPPSGGSE
jgi:hypothetical protein